LRAGEDVGRDRVKRLMRAHAIQGAKRRGKPWRTTIADPAATRKPDRVNRDFTAPRRDALWLADFTYLRCWESVVFFSSVIDAYSHRIVGSQFASHMRTTLVMDALRMALTPPPRRPRRARAPLRCQLATRVQPVVATPVQSAIVVVEVFLLLMILICWSP
jgi:transposase InsO family protein